MFFQWNIISTSFWLYDHWLHLTFKIFMKWYSFRKESIFWNPTVVNYFMLFVILISLGKNVLTIIKDNSPRNLNCVSKLPDLHKFTWILFLNPFEFLPIIFFLIATLTFISPAISTRDYLFLYSQIKCSRFLLTFSVFWLLSG